jgi:hypothetical protein
MLSYNFAFARGVQSISLRRSAELLSAALPFSIAGALLSRRLKVPLILEYNGSGRVDRRSLGSYPFPELDQVVRGSDAAMRGQDHCGFRSAQAELSGERYSGRSHSGESECCGSRLFLSRTRERAGTQTACVRAQRGAGRLCGIIQPVARNRDPAAGNRQVVEHPPPCRLRFVLMGDGLLHGEMRSALAAYENTGEVIFTGPLPRDKVAEYLDASDILVSPHIPMPDGSRFFGSPTKLFEYMAMGKGIVASRLEQLAEVLEHDRTAWLVTPGDVKSLRRRFCVLRWIQRNVKRLARPPGVPRSSATAGREMLPGR